MIDFFRKPVRSASQARDSGAAKRIASVRANVLSLKRKRGVRRLPMKVAILGFILLTSSLVVAAPPVPTATQAINALGLDLWRATSSTKDNLLLSPYSIQSALAMTYAGAAGVTRDEMMKVLHYPQDASTLHDSFAQLRLQLATGPKSTKSAEPGKTHDATVAPLTLSVANRLYAQRDYAFKTNFLSLLNGKYDTSLVPVDFKKNAAGVATEINKWVEQQTHERIRNLISPTALDESTRLVLVNALYFKAVWAESFPITATTTEPFNIRGGAEAEVPMMIRRSHFGHVPFRGGQAVTVPYRGGEFQFLILLPDSTNGLSELQKTLTPEFLQQCASLKQRDVVLHLPKFTFEPPTLALSSVLKVLGMKT
ncbi:MAG: serpin family protein, partial [Verrucomicrobiales bacterium]|nr:serpin family protein [Verrucomicrobiales bacterium]